MWLIVCCWLSFICNDNNFKCSCFTLTIILALSLSFTHVVIWSVCRICNTYCSNTTIWSLSVSNAFHINRSTMDFPQIHASNKYYVFNNRHAQVLMPIEILFAYGQWLTVRAWNVISWRHDPAFQWQHSDLTNPAFLLADNSVARYSHCANICDNKLFYRFYDNFHFCMSYFLVYETKLRSWT